MRKKFFLFLLAAVLVLGAAGGTLGYYKSSAGVTNRISTKESGVTLREVFNPADHWLPGETKEKQGSFSNSGDVPQVIRFQYTGKWSDSSGASLPEPAVPPTVNLADTGNWEKIGDWYYYKKVLQPAAVTANVIKSVTFDKSLTNGGYDGKTDYSGKRYALTVTMESLSANTTETVAGWNMTFTDSGGTLTWQSAT